MQFFLTTEQKSVVEAGSLDKYPPNPRDVMFVHKYT